MAFEKIFEIDAIPPDGWRGVIKAPSSALVQIAERLGTVGVTRLRGDIELSKTTQGVRVSGMLDAALTRECVASLDLFDEVIREPFEIDFAAYSDEDQADDSEIDLASPEPLPGQNLDLAEILIQQLSLAMAPFPRKPGATSLVEEFAPPQTVSAFDDLKSKIAEDGERG